MATNRRMGWLAAGFMVGGMLLSRAAVAGPPLICFPYHTDGAKSLPWGDDAFRTKSGYDKSSLVKDTLALLKTEESVLARMETLRRAAIYAQGDKALSTELLAKLGFIALDMEADGKPAARSWFNAGFLAACYHQLGTDIDWNPGQAHGANGYAWIRKALESEPESPEMHFAAALATHGREGVYKEHMRKAVAGAKPGSALAKSIEANGALGGKIDELRKSLGVADASKPGN
jgi:hypothetical protein